MNQLSFLLSFALKMEAFKEESFLLKFTSTSLTKLFLGNQVCWKLQSLVISPIQKKTEQQAQQFLLD